MSIPLMFKQLKDNIGSVVRGNKAPNIKIVYGKF